jgi:phosphatidylethanolamine/phosphatidyl-N-methylethanolamine N-methyltransferase
MDTTASLLAFSGQLLRHPRQVSALAPSSPALCRMMARQLPRSAVYVAEFGPGLGNVTREILRAGVAPQNLRLFELNSVFCEQLRDLFPGVTVVNAPAQSMTASAATPVNAVVSGLPLLSMPRGVQRQIVSAAFGGIVEDGVYIQFTYGPTSPLHASVTRELGLTFTRTVRVWKNIPPATVYVYRRAR